MKFRWVIYATLTGAMLGGCGESVEVGAIEVPPSQVGELVEYYSKKSSVDSVRVLFNTGRNSNEEKLLFGDKGIITGYSGPMIPLSADKSDLEKLGFGTYISVSGDEAKLTYNDTEIRLKRNYALMYVDNTSVNLADDRPVTNNSTLYVPLVPILEALNIRYKLEGTELIIGEMHVNEYSQN